MKEAEYEEIKDHKQLFAKYDEERMKEKYPAEDLRPARHRIVSDTLCKRIQQDVHNKINRLRLGESE